MKKVAVLFCICALFVGVLAACGNGGTAEGGIDGIETFTVLALGGLSYDRADMDCPIGQRLSEITGVRLVYEFPVGDWTEKLALVIASGDYPDIIAHEGTSMSQLVEVGALVPLRERIENTTYLSALLGDQIGRLAFSIDDPEFYGFGGTTVISEPRPDAYWGVSFAVQFSALEYAGYPMITTLQDFEDVIANYIASNPEINGQPALGLSLVAADGWRWKISVTNPSFLASGLPDDGEWFINPETFQATSHYRNPEAREYFRWLNHMNNIGLLDPESFTQSYDAYQAKVSSGRVIGLIDALWQYDIARLQAISQFGYNRDYMGFPVLLDPENTIWSSARSSGFVNAGGYSITTAATNVDRIVDFFDFIASEEGMILRGWGIEDEHYTIEDGIMVRKPWVVEQRADMVTALEFRRETGIGKFAGWAMFTPGFGFTLSNGQLLDDFCDQESFDNNHPAALDALNAYGIRGFNMLFPPSSAIPSSPWGAAWTLPIGQSEETRVIVQLAEDATLRNVARAVLADPVDFDTEWDNFMAELDAINVQLVEEEVTALVYERMRMWGYR